MKVTIKLEDGTTITRKPKFHQMGNFVMAVVRYKNEDYLLGDWEGDEYIRDEDPTEKVYKLGNKMER